jgi:hypothetical protein
MSRRAARITHDEVCRMVKAVRECGLSIGRVSFDGERLDIVIGSGEIVDIAPSPAGQAGKVVPLLREPKL